MTEEENKVQFYYGDSLIFENGGICTGAYESKYVICPKCLRTTILVKDYPNDAFQYHAKHDPYPVNVTLKIRNEKEFLDHIKMCTPVFDNDGIYKCNSEKMRELGVRFHFIGRNELGYIEMLVYESAYVYVRDKLPISYIMFYPFFFTNSPTEFCLSNVFTFPKYRKQNIATELFQFAIDDLKLDVSDLWYSPPLTLGGARLLRKFATDILTPMCYEGGPQSVDELEEYIQNMNEN